MREIRHLLISRPYSMKFMPTLIQAIKIVFSERRNILLGIASSLFFGGVFLFGTGMITFYPTGPYIEFIPTRIATLIALITLSGITVPVQLHAIKKAKAGLKEGASGAGGLLAGMATMSCCAPLLLPAVLSFVGFSGTQLLFLSVTVRQYALYLSIISIGLLVMSLFMASRSVCATCRIDIPKEKQ